MRRTAYALVLLLVLPLQAAAGAAPAVASSGGVHLGAAVLDPRLGLTTTNGAVERVFLGPGDDPALTPTGRPVIVSMRSCDPAYQRAVVQRISTGLVTFVHEPEQEITKTHRFTAQRWVSCNLQLARIVAQERPGGAVGWTAILMRWDLDPQSHREQMLRDVLTPEVLALLARSVLLWDAYPSGLLGDGDPERMYSVPAAWSTAHGLPYGFAETHQQTAAGWRRAFSWVAVHRPAYFLVYNPDGRPDYRTQDDPEAAHVVWSYAHAPWALLSPGP